MSVDSLYTHLLVKAGRDESHLGKPENSSGYSIETGNNPLCGDSITWFIKTEHSVITDIRYEVKGCLISKASASFLSSLMDGKHITVFSQYFNELKKHIQLNSAPPAQQDLEKRNWLALAQIQAYPTRKKCVLLAWETLERALQSTPSENT